MKFILGKKWSTKHCFHLFAFVLCVDWCDSVCKYSGTGKSDHLIKYDNFSKIVFWLYWNNWRMYSKNGECILPTGQYLHILLVMIELLKNVIKWSLSVFLSDYSENFQIHYYFFSFQISPEFLWYEKVLHSFNPFWSTEASHFKAKKIFNRLKV